MSNNIVFLLHCSRNCALTIRRDAEENIVSQGREEGSVAHGAKGPRAGLARRFSKVTLIGPAHHAWRAEAGGERDVADRSAFGHAFEAGSHPLDADLLHELGNGVSKAGSEVPATGARRPAHNRTQTGEDRKSSVEGKGVS